MKTHKLVYTTAFVSLFTLVIGAILMIGGNHIGDYMVATGAIVSALIMHKLDWVWLVNTHNSNQKDQLPPAGLFLWEKT